MATLAVLAIDDEEIQHMLLSRLLRDGSDGYSYELASCPTLEAAFDRLDQGPPIGVVLLDLGLSATQGIETVTRFGSRINDYPLIILTGNADQDVARRALHMGAEDYLDKTDLTAEILQRAIRYSVERFGLKRDLERARYEREIEITQEMVSVADSPVTSQLYGQRGVTTRGAQYLRSTGHRLFGGHRRCDRTTRLSRGASTERPAAHNGGDVGAVAGPTARCG